MSIKRLTEVRKPKKPKDSRFEEYRKEQKQPVRTTRLRGH